MPTCPASTATTLSLLEPAVTAALAVLSVGERLPATGWMGTALVIACLAVLTIPTPTRNSRGRLRNSVDHDSDPPARAARAA
ncbi:EamA family transporter [Streptomyces dangxiongensis]|uniref:EamA family transporter n=1 Tax=Streptomyces dangxiongensis TaxID=1442032 RepID=UPI0030B85C5C